MLSIQLINNLSSNANSSIYDLRYYDVNSCITTKYLLFVVPHLYRCIRAVPPRSPLLSFDIFHLLFFGSPNFTNQSENVCLKTTRDECVYEKYELLRILKRERRGSSYTYEFYFTRPTVDVHERTCNIVDLR